MYYYNHRRSCKEISESNNQEAALFSPTFMVLDITFLEQKQGKKAYLLIVVCYIDVLNLY